MRGIFVYIFITGFALGVALYSFYDFGISFALLFVAIALILFFINRARLFLLTILLIAFAFGAVRMHFVSQDSAIFTKNIDEKITLEGIINSEPDVRSNHINLEVLLRNREKILVQAGIYNKFRYGDKLQLIGILKKPKKFDGDDGRSFNYPRYLALKDIYYVMSYPQIKVVSHGSGNFVKRWLFNIKSRYLNVLARTIPEPASALAGGITVGAKRSLGEELEKDFRNTGIIHIVVLSGYNVMIIASFLLWIFSFFSKNIGAAIGGILIALFTIMTGGGATVVRASAMGLLSLFATRTGRTYVAVRALAIVAFVMLLWNPKILIADISFQLSFVATLGLIFGLSFFRYGNYSLLKLDTQKEGISDLEFKDILIATISTQIAVLPLILYYMGNLSLVSIFVNILVLPTVSIAMLAVFIAGSVGMFSIFIAMPFAWVAYIFLEYILKIVDIFAKLPFASIHFGAFSFWWVVLSYGLLIGFIIMNFNNSFEVKV